jgi:galactokinase
MRLRPLTPPLCSSALQKNGVVGGSAAKAFFVPGRVEVLGKHTDYAGGRSLLMAVSKAFCV